MMESSLKKKNLFYTIVLILTLITMIIGATLAFYKLIASQKEDSTVLYTGTLQIQYLDGVYIKDPELYPMKNVNYNTYKNVYRNNFAVVSTGTLEGVVSVDVNITKNEFYANALKYAIYNSEGVEMTNGFVPQSGRFNLTSNLYLKSHATTRYTLIIWLDNTNYNQNFEMGKTVSGKIEVYAKQLKY